MLYQIITETDTMTSNTVCPCLCVFYVAHSLVVQDPSGSLTLKLLLLQDAFKIFHALVRVLHVSRQMAVEEADGVAEHGHSCTHATFVALGHQQQPEKDKTVRVKEVLVLVS